MRIWPSRKQKSEQTPLDAILAVLHQEGIPLAAPASGRRAQGARFVEVSIHLDQRRAGSMTARKAANSNTLSAIQAAARVEGLYARPVENTVVYQYQLDEAMWSCHKRADLLSPDGIGLGVERTPVTFALDKKSALIAGDTLSGKSVTIESILFALMGNYNPDEMGLVIIDPNMSLGNRIEGKRAGSFTNVAHLLRPVAYSRRQVAEAIDSVYGEWKHRVRNTIQGTQTTVLVIDDLMSEAVIGNEDACSQEYLTKLSQLASWGVANNIFLLIGTQYPKVDSVLDFLVGNLDLCFIGHVADSNASRALAGRDGVNAHLLTGSGDFIQVFDGTMVRFQVAEPTQDDFNRLERRPVRPEPVEQVQIINAPVRRPNQNSNVVKPVPLSASL